MTNILRQKQLFDREHQRRGWFTGVFTDPPYEVSEAHKHGKAHLLILEGTVEFTLGGTDIIELHAGHEIDIEHDQLHAAVAGDEGFTYAFACPPEEAVKQGLVA